MKLNRGVPRPFVVIAGLLTSLLPTGSARAWAQCLAPPADLVSRWPADGHPADVAGSNHRTLVGVAFPQAGGVEPLSWSVAGALPAGRAPAASTGVLSGTPTASGSFAFTVTATDTNGVQGSVSPTLTVDPAGPSVPGGLAFIPNSGDGTVSVVDTATNTVVGSPIAVGSFPRAVAVNSAGTHVYVANAGNDTVSVIDTGTMTVVATLAVTGIGYGGLAVTPDGAKVYVASYDANTVTVIDAATNAVAGTIPAASNPIGVATSPSGTRVYVSNHTGNVVSVIDTASDTVVATVPVDGYPRGLVASSDGARVYVVCGMDGENSVVAIDTATDVVVPAERVPLGAGGGRSWGIAIDPAGTRLYATRQNADDLKVIDIATHSVTNTVPVGSTPYGVAVNPTGTHVYVANYSSHTLSVIDATTFATSAVAVGSYPVAFGAFIAPSPPCAPLSAGLVSWWRAEDDAADAWGTNHGVWASGPSYAAGAVGRAFRLTGAVDSFIEVADDPTLDPAGAFSVDGWFYIDPAATGNTGELATLVSKSDGSPGSGFYLALDDRASTRKLWLVVGSGGGHLEAGLDDAIVAAGWYQVAAVFDPAAMPQARLYLNGAAVADSGGATIAAMSPNAWSLRIGAMHWTEAYGAGNDRLNGLVDEVELLGRALSAAEVAAIYGAGSVGHCTTCAYSIDPTSASAAGGGGAGAVSVTAGSWCGWTSTSNDPAWLTVTSGASGAGRGTVGYAVAANTGGPRAGTIDIAGQTFSVDQAAAMRTLTVSRDGSGSGRITAPNVDCGADCAESYEHGADVELTATADPGSAFIDWSGDCTGVENPFFLTMDGDKSCAATFEPQAVSIGARSKSVGTPPFVPNGPVTYTITLSNSGNSTQPDNPGHELVDALPPALTSISAGATSGTVLVEGSTVSWDGSLPSGGSVTITIDATIGPTVALGTTLSNQATIHYDANVDGTNESTVLTDDPSMQGADDPTSFVVVSPTMDFYTLEPCRLVDTRDPVGTYGAPALAAGTARVFPLAGQCGIPPTARALSVNLTVAQPAAAGNLRLYPAGLPVAAISSINYRAGQTRANNAIVALNGLGDLAVYCAQASETAHFILDVNGYFE